MSAMQYPAPEKFIWPVFLLEGKWKKEPIQSMPGQFQYSVDKLLEALEPVVKMGIGGVMLFAVPNKEHKSFSGEYAYNESGIIQQAIFFIKKEFPDLLVFTDVCVCAYMTHGHCGILNCNDDVDNDLTLPILAKMAVSHAEAGADGVAPSAMMDGQIQTLRTELDNHHFKETILMSYSTKFASAMYGPFRDAAGSAPGKGDRKGYQADYLNVDSALLESILDEQEGADILMVKPALFYLDIIHQIKQQTHCPVAAYNVSGEYSMIIATAERGWGDKYDMARESIAALTRAGVDIHLSYWANQYDEIFKEQ
jgi:porphobilinogen synthase